MRSARAMQVMLQPLIDAEQTPLIGAELCGHTDARTSLQNGTRTKSIIGSPRFSQRWPPVLSPQTLGPAHAIISTGSRAKWVDAALCDRSGRSTRRASCAGLVVGDGC